MEHNQKQSYNKKSYEKKNSEKKNNEKKNNEKKNYEKISYKQKSSKGSRCKAFGECGGCQMIDTPYEEQLKTKQKETQKLLAPFVKLENIIGMEEPEHYRNKVSAAFTHDRKGVPLSGVYKENSHYNAKQEQREIHIILSRLNHAFWKMKRPMKSLLLFESYCHRLKSKHTMKTVITGCFVMY